MKLTLLFTLLIFFIGHAHGAQIGIVRKNKAVIYADLDLKSPIGFVRKGKELAVGKVKRRRGEVLPVVVNGQVAWIRVEDLALPDEQKPFDIDRKITEHNIFYEDEVKDPLDQNNYLTIRTGPASPSVSFNNNVLGEQKIDVSNATETSLMFNHKNPYHSIHWGFGLEFVSGTTEFVNYRSINIKGGIAWVPIRFSLLSIEAYANLVLSGDFRMESRGIGEYKGNMFGLDYGVAARLFPESRFGGVAGLGLSQYNFSNLDKIQTIEDDTLTEVSNLTATKVFAGLTYRFD
jgi:hypothetical protein